MELPPHDFESCASASSATAAYNQYGLDYKFQSALSIQALRYILTSISKYIGNLIYLGNVDMARSGFQQRESYQIPMFISKTNSNEVIESQRAEARPL